MGQCRGLAGVIIPCHSEYATVARRTKGVSMFNSVHATVDTGPFAVPHAKNAIETRPLEQVRLLTAPHRRCGKVLINAWLEVNLMGIEVG